jgi:hypothetical protein
MQHNWQQFLLPDGVHIHTSHPHRSGMLRYLLSIRAAIVSAGLLLQ